MMTRLIRSAMGRTHNLLFWKEEDGTLTVETVWKPGGIQRAAKKLPPRPFTMACRPLCTKDLHRVHMQCVTGCRMRRTYYGKLPTTNKIDYVLRVTDTFVVTVIKRRRLARAKDLLLERVFLPIARCRYYKFSKPASSIISDLLAN